MKSMFDEPKDVDFFLNTYGCFMMHCGAWRMGCPGPEDNHPLHGELPYAAYDTAEIIFDRDEKGEYIGITGAYSYDLALCNIKYFEEYGSVKFNLFAGYLNKEETQSIKDRLKNILV